MSDQGRWQVAGNAAEIYERALVPGVASAGARRETLSRNIPSLESQRPSCPMKLRRGILLRRIGVQVGAKAETRRVHELLSNPVIAFALPLQYGS
jgi:hypothetical protein